MTFKPHGIVVPIVTPVTQDGKFNEKAYRDLIEYLASSGIHGVFPFGTTGEFYAHDMGFYREVLAVTKDAVRGRMDIYAGANNITTRGAVEIAKAVEQVGGIDALSVLTPMFVSQTQYEVSEYYREIASETNLPIIIYNNRPKTNVTVEPATVAKLAEIDNISNYINEMTYKFITGAEPLTNFDTYMDTLQKMGIENLIQLHQEAYDSFMSRGK